MYESHSVAVVVPAYNEAGLVGEVIETIPAYVDRIYAVDDRSTDGTWDEIVRHAARRNGSDPDPVDGRPTSRSPRDTAADGGVESGEVVVPIRHEENRGVGGAITTGYQYALADGIDVTAVMAGDGQMNPDHLEWLLEPIVDGTADYAKGNRLYGNDRSSMSSWRLFGNLTLSYLTKIASGYWRMMDPQNGYTAISHDALEAIDLEDRYEAYGFTNDLLVTLNTHGFRIADVSMPAVYGEEESHIQYRSFVPNLSALLLRRFVRRLYVRYLLTDFHPLALMYAVGVAGGMIALAGITAAVRRRANGSSDGMTSLVLLFLSVIDLLLAMVFDRRENEEMVVTVP
ncbi:glycosyltransferase family 2 protein [Natrialbaceae archaeon AArc-T1-2]|uniref:glycosyltransferase family 2 protein n=1 Tax=Natrialbaceae archaeon AArc-T1-2 TaxID=3053904 RepID=UPI00255A7C61|nr:glycosyltransferase family 2 protein [Natrialbaceae archaeon AArc-T1-2]WIV66206.1 glycosyltransferase family 2 protein [Natrialbaceae archaeon AArc-T1-2]